MINSRSIIKILGFLLVIEGILMLTAAPVSLIYNEWDTSEILLSSIITMLAGALILLFTRRSPNIISKKEGFITVTAAWVTLSLFGTLPYLISGAIPAFTDAFFETLSGFTTTGASILDNVENLSHGMIYWRCLTQWIGGMGVIIFSLAVLPLLGIGGMELFVAETEGAMPDKLHPRVRGTAQRFWIIYVIFTVSEIILLLIGNMNLFDAVCHSFSTIATGGFSTRQAGIAYWNSPFITYVITFFMFVAGMNFTLSYFAVHFKFSRIFRDEEFRFYLGIILSFTIILSLVMIFTMDRSLGSSIKDVLFQVVSITSTTGFITADYDLWNPLLIKALLILMFIGASAGSTGGSIKALRVLLVLKNASLELRRLLHPNAVIPVRYNQQAIKPEIITNVVTFVSFYILIAFGGTIIMSAYGYNVSTSLGTVASCLGNIGPGLGHFGPTETCSQLPIFLKWVLSFLMLAGRLELFTVLVLFTPGFWRK